MADVEDAPQRSAGRVERVVRDLLSGRRLGIGPADAAERDAIMAAARLAGARDPYPRMTATFRKRLARQLQPAGGGRLLSRRTAIVAAISAAAGAVAATAAGRLTGLAGSPEAVRGRAAPFPGAAGTLLPRPGTWFDAGLLAGFAEGQAVRFQAGAVGAYLVRRGDQVHAMSSICTHLPCELAWHAREAQLVCPCHNLGFDTEGASVVGDGAYPLPPLPRLQVRVTGGRVEVLGA